MMPFEPVLDIMRRTMANLDFVERHAAKGGPYEVTQLINSFLGALAHPWEEFRVELEAMPLEEAAQGGWPIPTNMARSKAPVKTLGEVIRRMRNGLAHGNLHFRPDAKGEITALEIENWDRGQRKWQVTITPEEMRRFLVCFVALVEEIDAAARHPRLIA